MRAIRFLLFIALLALIPAAMAQETPVPAPPFETWSGSFEVSPTIPFVWVRATPQAGGAIVGTLFPGQMLTAVLPTDAPGLFYEAANDQWWGYFSAGRLVGWIETSRVTEMAAEPAAESTAMVATDDPSSWLVSESETVEVSVRRGVPFVWLRDTAASDGGIVRTLRPGALLMLNGERVLDANQYWWPVRDENTGNEGFIEQSALEYIRQVDLAETAPVGQWIADDVLTIRAGVPFVWVRGDASSTSDIITTLLRGSEVTVVSGPQNDGVQNWWEVSVSGSDVSGWVEEDSLQRVR